MLVFQNRDCLSSFAPLFVSSNTTLLELQTLLFLFFFQNLHFQIGGVAYLRMRLIHGRLRYVKDANRYHKEVKYSKIFQYDHKCSHIRSLGWYQTACKPGYHMPPTYLGHSQRHGLGQSCGICEHLSPAHNLTQALTAGLPAKLSSTSQESRQLSAIVGDENVLSEHHLQSCRTSGRRLNPYLEVKWLKTGQFDLHFEQV